jgi:hypothetical protein
MAVKNPSEAVLMEEKVHSPTPATPPPLPTSWEFNVLICIVSIASLFAILVLLNYFELPTPKCAWKSATGIPCAGCGGTRAGILLLNGDIIGAFAINPLATMFAMISVAVSAYSVLVIIGVKKPLRLNIKRRSVVLPTIAVALVVANWIYLLLAGRV